ncbi:zf-TFIIB domain-containing protein [Sphingomonas mesophila]|uniref:TFIIB-type zinc ribbon-containing protein n=1 Tax=Sphingomonas mesophila TaxID=2303576 RepID=UPI001F07C3F7|nr:zf-TFIIB domain-containing protein [Sphingomonas mesophila]
MAHGPMACPIDGTTLVMSERQGIEIDYCPSCRGVWLDRGELDKIIEKSAGDMAPPPPPQQQQQAAPPPPPQGSAPWGAPPPPPPGYGYDPRYGHKPYKRRKSFLEELFD